MAIFDSRGVKLYGKLVPDTPNDVTLAIAFVYSFFALITAGTIAIWARPSLKKGDTHPTICR
jgi:hypothetical protein